MAERRREESAEVALAFSGGGFRATLFHIGVCLRLADLGMLDKVSHISATSGGAVFAAYLLTKWERLKEENWKVDAFKEEVQQPLVKAITSRSFRGTFLKRTAFWGLAWPVAILVRPNIAGQLYDECFFSGKRLPQLPRHPLVHLNATELRTGTSWRFSQDEMGSYWSGKIRYDDIPDGGPLVSTGVAASAAFPFVFRQQSVALPRGGQHPEGHPSTVSLVDGGIYDNIAVEPFLKPEFGRARFIVVSDAGYPSTHSWAGRIPLLSKLTRLRSIGLVLADNLRRRWIVESLLSGYRRGCYVRLSSNAESIVRSTSAGRQDITSYEDGLPREIVASLAQMRTDLDRFSPGEADLLGYHGYTMTDACLLKYSDALRTSTSNASSYWPSAQRTTKSNEWKEWAVSVLAKSGSHFARRQDPAPPTDP